MSEPDYCAQAKEQVIAELRRMHDEDQPPYLGPHFAHLPKDDMIRAAWRIALDNAARLVEDTF